jgi:hypothetical protein
VVAALNEVIGAHEGVGEGATRMSRAEKYPRRLSLLGIAAVAMSLGCDGTSGPSTCATAATPDLIAQAAFDIDTGLSASTRLWRALGGSAASRTYLMGPCQGTNSLRVVGRETWLVTKDQSLGT